MLNKIDKLIIKMYNIYIIRNIQMQNISIQCGYTNKIQ